MSAPNMRFVPYYWQHEKSGVLRPVIEDYLNGRRLSPKDVFLMRAYLRQWIFAPGWEGNEIDGLRDMVDSLTTEEQIRTWLWRASQIGIDPL